MTYTISPENRQIELDIQKDINECLDNFESFCFDAGAGAGKTYALQKSIEHILKTEMRFLVGLVKILLYWSLQSMNFYGDLFLFSKSY